MGGTQSKNATDEEAMTSGRKSAGQDENLPTVERIRKHTVTHFGFRVLILARRGMLELPEELWELTELQKLNLSLNLLRSIPSSLAVLQNLVVLNLWGNQLTSLPPEVGRLRNLKVLFAYRNRLSDVPEELGCCTKLEVLSLANNQLTGLPASLSALSGLKKLNLSHNHITHIPACVYTMKNLVFLQLACNKLENIADQIQALIDLKILILEGNCIHSLPKMICGLTKLELLNVDFNDIQNVPAEMHRLRGLERLACHPLDKGLHIMHNPLVKPIKDVLDGGVSPETRPRSSPPESVLRSAKIATSDQRFEMCLFGPEQTDVLGRSQAVCSNPSGVSGEFRPTGIMSELIWNMERVHVSRPQ
ncbi:hypothetical protein E1301_Tti022224 [Triplophysa tibetana]|uniref:Leucine-rich repeat-containing protein 30 n=1 Tax=Triplophysa tibetana TaxID=1572043 RepID=A0A5A9N7H4_9TELE|nr:hypothetical protein E1301_Tti022224 [Triplophysa tibetana]